MNDDFVDAARYAFAYQPRVAGFYLLSPKGSSYQTQFGLAKKPCWLHRTMVRLVLGWRWVDA